VTPGLLEGRRKIVIALGGNSIIPAGKRGTIEEQREVTAATMEQVATLVKEGHMVVITHGNGPVVGNIFIRNEMAKEVIPAMPLDVCGADSEGGIGYMIQQILRNRLRRMNVDKDVITIITQVVVEEEDPAFGAPTKPIGPFYDREEADWLSKAKGWTIVEDSGRGYRRVVPSPRPLKIVEFRAIERAIDGGAIVIAVGGGGVPVVHDAAGELRGVEAVIDKDRASGVLARQLGAEIMIILTSVAQVSLRFGTPDQVDLDHLSLEDARKHLAGGEFPPGSMGPKIESAIDFLEQGGDMVVITRPEMMSAALEGRECTRITR
jgi:carbamate kinase